MFFRLSVFFSAEEDIVPRLLQNSINTGLGLGKQVVNLELLTHVDGAGKEIFVSAMLLAPPEIPHLFSKWRRSEPEIVEGFCGNGNTFFTLLMWKFTIKQSVFWSEKKSKWGRLDWLLNRFAQGFNRTSSLLIFHQCLSSNNIQDQIHTSHGHCYFFKGFRKTNVPVFSVHRFLVSAFMTFRTEKIAISQFSVLMTEISVVVRYHKIQTIFSHFKSFGKLKTISHWRPSPTWRHFWWQSWECKLSKHSHLWKPKQLGGDDVLSISSTFLGHGWRKMKKRNFENQVFFSLNKQNNTFPHVGSAISRERFHKAIIEDESVAPTKPERKKKADECLGRISEKGSALAKVAMVNPDIMRVEICCPCFHGRSHLCTDCNPRFLFFLEKVNPAMHAGLSAEFRVQVNNIENGKISASATQIFDITKR